MSEVKKSYFIALDPEESVSLADDAATAAQIAAAGDFYSDWPVVDTHDDRNAYVLEPSGLPDLTLDYEEVTRDVIVDSYLPAVPLRGIINSTGSMTVELHSGGKNGGASLMRPDYHPLLKSAYGGAFYNGDETASAGDIATVTQLNTSGGWPAIGTGVTGLTALTTGGSDGATAAAAGDVVVVKDQSNQFFFIQLTGATAGELLGHYPKATAVDNTGNTLTYAPFSAYFMPSVLTGIPSFAIAYYRANIVREIYAKAGVTSYETPLNAGEIILPVFNMNIGDGAVASQDYWNGATNVLSDTNIFTTATNSVTSSSASPLFAKATDWTLEYRDVVTPGSWTEFSDKITDSVVFRVNNEASTKRDITAADGIHSYGIQGRSVEVVITAYYDDDAGDFAENPLKFFLEEGNKYRIRATAISGDTDGNRVFNFAPRMSFRPLVTEDAGLFKWEITCSGEKDPDDFGETALVQVYF